MSTIGYNPDYDYTYMTHSSSGPLASANAAAGRFTPEEKTSVNDVRIVMAVKNSCTRYISASVVIHFPESEGIQCKLCPCLETYARKQCRLTGEYLADGYLVGGL